MSGNTSGFGGGIFIWSGIVNITDVEVFDNISYSNGGGIRNNYGAVDITNSNISGNSATELGYGGGISSGGTLTLNNSAVSGNSASMGGGISNDGTLTLNNSTVSGNSATTGGNGGGIINWWSGTLTLNNSTVSGNTASFGGGIDSEGGTAVLNNSTVSGNTAINAGGIINGGGMLTLNNSTVSGNTASGNGGGINKYGGIVTLQNTIIAGNTASGAGPDCNGEIGSSGYNLIGDTSGCTFASTTGDLTNIDPLLGPLQDNGGPTETHALLPDSPAIDAGDDSACPATDQRGEPRPADGDGDGTATCDIGAYEAPDIGGVYEVPVDIRPTSCPNPMNVESKGVLPVAILGTADLGVTQVDPATVELEGVFPLRWSIKDVATPYEPFVGKEGAYDCTKEGPDGYTDLTLKFDTQEIVAALGPVNDGDVLVLSLTGSLLSGEGFVGEDVVWIIKKGK